MDLTLSSRLMKNFRIICFEKSAKSKITHLDRVYDIGHNFKLKSSLSPFVNWPQIYYTQVVPNETK